MLESIRHHINSKLRKQGNLTTLSAAELSVHSAQCAIYRDPDHRFPSILSSATPSQHTTLPYYGAADPSLLPICHYHNFLGTCKKLNYNTVRKSQKDITLKILKLLVKTEEAGIFSSAADSLRALCWEDSSQTKLSSGWSNFPSNIKPPPARRTSL